MHSLFIGSARQASFTANGPAGRKSRPCGGKSRDEEVNQVKSDQCEKRRAGFRFCSAFRNSQCDGRVIQRLNPPFHLPGLMDKQRVIPLIVATALFMENMDSTVIATSLPAI